VIQKYRDEVENDRKPGGMIATVCVCVGDFPSSASQDQLRQPRSTRGEVASVSKVEAESSDRFRGLGGLDRPALAELDLVGAESQSALMQTPTARPVWVNGTLPGIMAGKRPAPWPTRSN
jgi:hypothetical protein